MPTGPYSYPALGTAGCKLRCEAAVGSRALVGLLSQICPQAASVKGMSHAAGGGHPATVNASEATASSRTQPLPGWWHHSPGVPKHPCREERGHHGGHWLVACFFLRVKRTAWTRSHRGQQTHMVVPLSHLTPV